MFTITTATGKEFQSDYLVANYSAPKIYLRVLNETKETVLKVFQDPKETASFVSGGKTYEGFTNCVGITQEGDAWKVALKHG